ncbi:cell division protein FtsQ, partial [Flavobacteriaceae bacterium]|nr:cell division protein FtsQ [Flavobacteriaceae bacterium]
DKFWNRECVAISYDHAEGWSLQTRSADHKIIVGELTQLEKKLRKYEIFLVTAMNQGLADSYEKVNLKFNNQVVCSK